MIYEQENIQKQRKYDSQIILWAIIFVGLFHALIYAFVMPPWGIIDEIQHFHYIQFIAEEHRLPVMWQEKLSEDIIDSMLTSKRYFTLFGTQMPSRTEIIDHVQLDYESYEAYQPPIYYLFLSLFYPLGPDDVLSKLFILRVIGVLLSTITLSMIWISSRLLFPQKIWVAAVATLFVALLPERAISVAQLNNDILLEVMCAILFLLLVRAAIKGFNWQITLLMGLAMGVASLTKLSALIVVGVLILAWGFLGFRYYRRWKIAVKQMFTLGLLTFLSLAPFFIRNFILYRGLTGIEAFSARVGDLVQGTWLQRLQLGTIDLFRNSWVILWDGTSVTTKPSATFLLVLLFLMMIFIAVSLVAGWHRDDKSLPRDVIIIGFSTICLVSGLTLYGYIKGFLPMVQGRFLLPVTVPSAWLVGLGLWFLDRRWRNFVASTLLASEFLLSMSVLFFHTLPKYYALRTDGFLGYWQQTRYLFSAHGLFWDKPNFITPTFLVWVIVGFILSGAVSIIWGSKVYEFPVSIRLLFDIKNTLQREWQNIKPEIPHLDEDISYDKSSVNILKDPLVWAGVSLFLIYLVWMLLYPKNIFWSLDEGGKFIHLKNIVSTGNLLTSINYIGGKLDTNLEFVPLYFWSRINNQIYSWWAIGFPMVTIPFYVLFGWVGLYILPAGFGALTAVLTGMIVRLLEPKRKKLSFVVVLITGLATPILFYSTTFWEHTISSGLFLGGVLAILYAWKSQRISFLLWSSILLSIATYFRVETSLFVAGILGIFVLIQWRWAIMLGVEYLISSVPWGILNVMLTGDVFSRRSTMSALNTEVSWFPGIKEAGWWFAPYTLFNAPKIGAFAIPKVVLILASISVILAIFLPIFSKKGRILLFTYSVIVVVSGWVLFQPQGYHSVHGVLLIAPYLVFATMIFLNKDNFQKTPLFLMIIGMILSYAGIYVVKGWVAAGGLQWGPRYLINFYPLLTITAIVGLVNSKYRLLERNAFIVLFSLAVLVGGGFQIRGLVSALQTRQYYEQTKEAINELPSGIVVTDCSWLSMVMPEIYFNRMLFVVKDVNEPQWKNFVLSHHIVSFYYVKMDLCSAHTSEKIKKNRDLNPSGLTINYIDTSK